MMKVTALALRKIIREAVVDRMRLPRGPNSRDDAEDHDLNDQMTDHVNVEEIDASTDLTSSQ